MMESIAKPHALVFPIPLQGHINPMMLLARQLASMHTMVTFLHTERSSPMLNIGDMDDDKENLSYFKMEVLPDCSHDVNLSVTNAALQFLNNQSLYKNKLEEIMKTLEEKGDPVSCIVSDSFLPWTQDVANKFGIPRIEFWSSSVTVYSMGYHIPKLINKGYLPIEEGCSEDYPIDIIPGLETFRLGDFFYDIDSTSISSPLFDIVCNAFSRGKEASKVIVNSFYHLESDVIDAMRVEGVMVEAMGPILNKRLTNTSNPWIRLDRPVLGQSNIDLHKRMENNMELTWSRTLEVKKVKKMSARLTLEDRQCMDWLDGQEVGSVIYAAFGSMVTLDAEEVYELGLGLEASGRPFLMVVRPGIVEYQGQTLSHVRVRCRCRREGLCQSHEQGQCQGRGQGQGQQGDKCEDGVKPMSMLLPKGFEERVKGRGKICEWAPQVEVLRHKAIGGFVSHCGWNSAMDSISAGVPLIGCPRESEQRTNLKCLKRWNLAIAMHDPLIEVLQDKKHKSVRTCPLERITRDLVASSIRRLMHDEEGNFVRKSVTDFRNRFFAA